MEFRSCQLPRTSEIGATTASAPPVLQQQGLPFGSLNGVSKSVQILSNGIEADVVLTLRILKIASPVMPGEGRSHC